MYLYFFKFFQKGFDALRIRVIQNCSFFKVDIRTM
ncbi:unnamed protein product [Brugia timori]|uniref:Uncharacterized protein n=1 Tax=Brugia timori TaxID=42155 RepID=A0A0R3QJF5_9BILA|nr:unnamed protein product [Brugia timori]